MANTYTLIQAQTLASAAATVTFSSIPATYTDLVLRVSARTTEAGPNELMIYTLNGNTGSNYSTTTLIGNAATVVSNRTTSAANIRAGWQDGDTATASTFGNAEIYIPSYTATQNKPTSNFSVAENNSAGTADTYINANAGLFRITAAITSIDLATINSNNFKIGSSFYLYGIKNS
jgi:hypothetical protein